MKKSIAADYYMSAFYKLFPYAYAAMPDYKIVDEKFIVEYERERFVVAHYNDFYETLKSYLDGDGYDKVLLLPVQLWDELVKSELEDLSNTEWLTSLYREWKNYWEQSRSEKNYFIIDKQREDSWKELQVLFTALSFEGSPCLVKAACRINDTVLIPIIAFAIKSHYTVDFYDDFLSDCILSLTQKCGLYISGGGR